MEKQKKSSNVWNYFNEDGNGKGKCGLCSALLSFKGGNIYNLSRHLKTKHPGVHNTHQEAKRTKSFLPSASASSVQSVDNFTATPLEPGSQTIISAQPTTIHSSRAQTTSVYAGKTTSDAIEKYLAKPLSIKKSKEIDEQLIRMIVKEYQPFSIVDDKEFKKFVKLLNPNYLLPSRKTISTGLIPQLYHQIKEKMKDDLKSVNALSMTTDGWSSANGQSFIAVTVHFINADMKLKSYLLDCFEYLERYTAENIAQEIKRVLRDYELLDKICMAITDNAANMVAAIKLCNFRHLPCFAHTVNLIVQYSLREIRTTLGRVKRIVEHFKRSPHASNKLHKMQIQMGLEQKKLKQDVPTRWNSTLEMLSRFKEIREPLLSVIGHLNVNLELPNFEDGKIIEKLRF